MSLPVWGWVTVVWVSAAVVVALALGRAMKTLTHDATTSRAAPDGEATRAFADESA